MSRLIDADEVVETLLCTPDVEEIFLDLAQKRRLDYLHNVEESDVVDFARDIVKAAIGVIKTSPTVDAVPVVHGEWMPHPRYDEFDVCSKCGTGCRKRMRGISNGMPYTEEVYYGFCPNCGAKMDGERKEE